MIPLKLDAFLKAEENSRSREYLLTARLVHDLTTAAACRNYALAVYLPAVDRDGFDLILGDGDLLAPIQIKSVCGAARTWEIHRKLLRPRLDDAREYGLDPSQNGSGLAGAIVLITAHAVDARIESSYAYLDINTLAAMRLRVFRRKRGRYQTVEKVWRGLQAAPDGVVEVPESMFITARTPEHLLALAGLHSRINSAWPCHLRWLCQHENQHRELAAPRHVMAQELLEELRLLVIEPLVPG